MLTVETIDLYYGAAQALRRVSLGAEVGKITCVLGRNGVGKSSLLRAIVGHQPVSAGKIRRRQGHHPHARPRARAARHRLRAAGARDLPAADRAGEPRDRLRPLARAGRTIGGELFELFPVLKSMLGRRGGDLSGGQQQQLAIARAWSCSRS